MVRHLHRRDDRALERVAAGRLQSFHHSANDRRYAGTGGVGIAAFLYLVGGLRRTDDGVAGDDFVAAENDEVVRRIVQR